MNKLLVISLLVLTTLPSHSQTLHAFLFCKTFDKKIGGSVSINYANMKEELQLISTAIGYKYVEHALTTRFDFTAAKIENTISQAAFEERDIVVLFFSTHGARSRAGDSNIFPQLDIPPALISAYKKHLEMGGKTPKPMFVLTLIEACNGEQRITPQERFVLQQVETDPVEPAGLTRTQIDNLKNLFLNSCSIVATASQPKRNSLAINGAGSIFTDCFLASLNESISSDDVSWDMILNKTKNATYQRSKYFRYKHYPVWEKKYCGEAMIQSVLDTTAIVDDVRLDIMVQKIKRKKNPYDVTFKINTTPEDLNQIEKVVYYLHNTMPQPKVESFNRENNFQYKISVWGDFPIKAKIFYKSGETIDLIEEMDFSNLKK